MVRPTVHWLAAIALTALVYSSAVARSDDARPEDVLKAHGLKRTGQTFVIAAEADIQKRLYAARVAAQGVSLAMRQKSAYEQRIQEDHVLIQELTQRYTFVNEQLQQNLSVAEHNQLVAESNALGGRINLLRAEESDPTARQAIEQELPRLRASFIDAVLDLRERADAATKEYERLKADKSVQDALTAMSTKAKSVYKLGPTRDFLDKIKQIERYEKSVLTEQIELRDRNGVFEVDVTLNKTETVPMIFDTGASTVTISSALAQKIGLKPRATDRPIKMHVADGSVIEGKQMTIASMRLGKFTLYDVVCAVMPPDKGDAPPLLGQSFIGQFAHKVEAGRLILTRIETGDPAARPAETSRKRGGNARSPRGGGTNASAVKERIGDP